MDWIVFIVGGVMMGFAIGIAQGIWEKPIHYQIFVRKTGDDRLLATIEATTTNHRQIVRLSDTLMKAGWDIAVRELEKEPNANQG